MTAASGGSDLSGRVAAVTGGARGLGLATVEELARCGATVAIVDLDGAAADLKRELGDPEHLFAYDCDVTDSAAVDATVDAIVRDCGRLDIWVNNAGISHMGIPTEELGDEPWERSIAVMQTGVFYGTRAAGRAMLKQGRGAIVNIASIRSYAPKNGGLAYCAPKAAVLMITEIPASEWGSRGIRVNGVAPGGMRTPMWDEAVATNQLNEQEYIDAVPLRRLAETVEMARVVRFLASDDASYINGATIIVDGGASVFRPH